MQLLVVAVVVVMVAMGVGSAGEANHDITYRLHGGQTLDFSNFLIQSLGAAMTRINSMLLLSALFHVGVNEIRKSFLPPFFLLFFF